MHICIYIYICIWPRAFSPYMKLLERGDKQLAHRRAYLRISTRICAHMRAYPPASSPVLCARLSGLPQN